jgi:uncharacterized protein YdhG (YjbR/CyaY superfamily)
MTAEKPENIDEYIAGFPKDVQKILQEIRMTIKKAASTAEESISYAIPAYKLKGRPLIYFAAFKNHIGLYATPSGNAAFAKELSDYKQGKGSVQLPLGKPMPLDLITKIVKFKLKEISEQVKK